MVAVLRNSISDAAVPRLGAILIVSVMAATFSTSATAELQFYFDEPFDPAEQQLLKTWITEVADGVESLVGPYPFDIQISFKRARGSGPVPWANTERGRRQGIQFHVDTRHSLAEFRRDWTAPHELSHLILPYIGREHAWFAEGFASFMQHQVMYATGAWGREEIIQRYQRRLDEAASAYRYPDRPFVEMTSKLREERKFRALYWGGAVYFLQLDKTLKNDHNTSLISLLSTYLRCCRLDRDEIENLIAVFDRLAGKTVSATELTKFQMKPGFPQYGIIDHSIVDQIRSIK